MATIDSHHRAVEPTSADNHHDHAAEAQPKSAPTAKGATPPHAPAHSGEKAAFGGGMAAGVSFFERNSQHDKYHSLQGHGFAAEDANALNDVLRGRHVEKVGTSNELNGADRIVDNVKIQVKYCQDAQSTFEELFDDSGKLRYGGMKLEVPKGQGEQVRELLKEKARYGPGLSN